MKNTGKTSCSRSRNLPTSMLCKYVTVWSMLDFNSPKLVCVIADARCFLIGEMPRKINGQKTRILYLLGGV